MQYKDVVLEVNHIFESGANEIRVIDFIKRIVIGYEKEILRLQDICVELTGMENCYQEGELFFGCYCTIEQKRFGAENEHYRHKVIGTLKSNSWVDVPAQTPRKEVLHSEVVDVVLCICEGISETEVRKYRRVDCKRI